MRKFVEPDVADNPLYHDTWKLLKKYRDVVWSLELSVQHVRTKFEIEYGTSIEDFLDSVYLAGADLAGSDIEHHAKCIERSHKMLKLLDSAVELLRTKHKNGEAYYWLLYYSFLSPQQLKNVEEIIETLNGSASTFNKQTNVRLDNKYTVLDISSLTGDLLTVGMFVALDFVWDRAKADRTEEKAIFIDECWQLLSGAGAAGVRLAGDFLLEIAKTIRGYGGASIFASQDLADFFDLDGGRFGKGIINNSKTKIILNLEDDEAQRVQEALHLSDAETMEITHFERGHGLISTNNNNIMVEFKASPLEKDLITTDRRELREIVERKRREQSTSAEQQI